MDLSIVIVHFRVKEFLWLCLSSLQEACASISYEIIVVDNASQDESQDFIVGHFKNLHWIQNTENLGFAKANNQGVDKAKGKYVLILNPDTVLSKKSIESFISFASTKNNFGVIGLKMIDGGGLYLPESKRNIPTPFIALKKLLGKNKAYYADDLNNKDVGEVDVLPGACMLLKRSVYVDVGGFSEDFFMYGEDIDLCFRLLKEGFKNYYFGYGTMIHFKGESTRKDAVYYKNFYGALQIYFEKHYNNYAVLRHLNKFLVKSLIVSKTYRKSGKLKSTKKENIIYLGNRSERSEQIRSTLSPKKWIYTFDIEKDLGEYDTLLIDQDYFGFDQIIDFFQQKKLLHLKKRIVLKGKNIVLGSDDSDQQGEILMIHQLT
ncbi:glycosyltransferase family 2 protein [Namhaeicola litoreus]|uniref:Glycosyltransferase family 2 protein n=1 Tax=Namhaeicola litoreus TaxID=1052145 RepID=A0ABW3Y2F9_9FLAO